MKSSASAVYKWRKEIIKSSCKRAQVLLVKNQSRDVLCNWPGGQVRGKKALLLCLKGGEVGIFSSRFTGLFMVTSSVSLTWWGKNEDFEVRPCSG